jgi:hypothetical protein
MFDNGWAAVRGTSRLRRAVTVVGASVFIAAPALVAAPSAMAASDTGPLVVVTCAYGVNTCSPGDLHLAPGQTVTFTKQALQDACKNGGYAEVGTDNQGQCVSFVNHTFPGGVTVQGGSSGDGRLTSDGNGGLIAN